MMLLLKLMVDLALLLHFLDAYPTESTGMYNNHKYNRLMLLCATTTVPPTKTTQGNWLFYSTGIFMMIIINR